tara:strand:- start:382 stop:849 length:468 start_codon:yes stop_codon:yes gene_type:complete
MSGFALLKGLQKLGGDIWSGSGASEQWEKYLGGGNWMQNDLFRFTGLPGMVEDFDAAWGGGNWMDRFGLPRGNDNDNDSGSSASTLLTDSNNDDDDTPVPTDTGLDIPAPLAGDVQMSTYLAQKRRKIGNKKGRVDTMLTRGQDILDVENRMMLS